MKSQLTVLSVLTFCFLAGCNSASKTANDPAAQPVQAQVAQAAAPADPNAAGAPLATTPVQSEIPATPAAVEPAPPPEPPAPVVIPAGTTITIRTGQALGSKTSKTGDSFTAIVTTAVRVRGKVAIPASSSATGSVVAAKAKGKVKGEGELDLTMTGLTIKGIRYPILTSVSAQTLKGKGKRTAVATGGGAAGGALIGGLAGGGRGAAIGAGVGAGAGFLGGTVTGNKQIDLPAETVISFQLKQSITLK